MGRPYVQIDFEKVEKLAAIGCSADEIAAELGIGERTIWRRCGTIMARGAKKSRIRLRSALFKHAMNGNPQILIYLGKAVLGLREPRDEESLIQNNLAISITVNEVRQIEAEAKPIRDNVASMFQKYRPQIENGNGNDKAIQRD